MAKERDGCAARINTRSSWNVESSVHSTSRIHTNRFRKIFIGKINHERSSPVRWSGFNLLINYICLLIRFQNRNSKFLQDGFSETSSDCCIWTERVKFKTCFDYILSIKINRSKRLQKNFFSRSGKSTLINQLFKEYPTAFAFSVSRMLSRYISDSHIYSFYFIRYITNTSIWWAEWSWYVRNFTRIY